jgi:hypothetical protein
MKRLFVGLSMLLLLATVIIAADNNLSGKWSGKFTVTSDEGPKDDSLLLELKHNGTELTGTAGPNQEERFPIQNGKIEGNKLTFQVQSPKFLINFELSLIDGHLKGEAKAEHDGKLRKAAVDLERKTE